MDDKTKTNPLADVHQTLERMETLAPESVFSFNCHSGLKCWGECCKNPNLFLTPYDVLRMRQSLKMKSGEFLARFTESYIGADFGLGVVRMKLDDKGQCPFLSEQGCSVYPDRPTSCRTYPIGQGVSSGGGKQAPGKVFFKVKEEHCLGWQEQTNWTVETWLEDQDVFTHNKENEFAAHLAFHPALGNPEEMDEKTVSMIFMSLYDLDRFREFVFKSSFLTKFEPEEALLRRAEVDDEALLDLGKRWVSYFALGGVSALKLRGGEIE